MKRCKCLLFDVATFPPHFPVLMTNLVHLYHWGFPGQGQAPLGRMCPTADRRPRRTNTSTTWERSVHHTQNKCAPKQELKAIYWYLLNMKFHQISHNDK